MAAGIFMILTITSRQPKTIQKANAWINDYKNLSLKN
jgi:hypothetical protein